MDKNEGSRQTSASFLLYLTAGFLVNLYQFQRFAARLRYGVDEIHARTEGIQEVLQSRVIQSVEAISKQLAARDIKHGQISLVFHIQRHMHLAVGRIREHANDMSRGIPRRLLHA